LALEQRRKKRLRAQLEINGITTTFTLDTGSSVNLLPLELARKLGVDRDLKPPECTLRMFSDQVLPVQGTAICRLHDHASRKVREVEFYVTGSHKDPIIGLPTCLDFNLIKVKSEHICEMKSDKDEPLTNETVLEQYADLFSGFGKFPGEVSLETDPSITPVRAPPRRIPLHLRDKVKAEIDNLCSNDILVPVTETTEWASPLLTTLKPNGGVRVVMDPQALNSPLKAVDHLLDHLDVFLSELSQAKVFNVCDLRHAFFHCVLEKPSQLK